MSRAIHVICGDAGGLSKGFAIPSKDVVSLRDYLPSGPVRGFSDLESWRAGRLAFWEGVYAAAAEPETTAKARQALGEPFHHPRA